MTDSNRRYRGALAIILYELHQERNKHIKEWTKHQEDYFLNGYGLEKIIAIAEAIEHYFKFKDIELDDVHPAMYATKTEKEEFLRFVLDGFKSSGLVK